jgi:cytochrome c
MKLKTVFILIGGLSVLPMIAAKAAPAADGGALFKQRCAICHASKAGAPSSLGPNLAGVTGRKAGATKFAYSSALKASKIDWNKPNLDRYLAGPTKMVPGTRMVINVSDAAQRAAIISHLATLR